ncbi:peptide-methionine (R)-S-oxide reductase MsrB [Pseudomonas sp. dw_358]|uniref:peptide-methionine (R)-S-oxide reductase MsrB n=1 Tax=Pseudomonas sp. dw_358 TaxID=2720083 RepID=UPI001BD2F6BD|nr:peptide-methionine (R)-S-oxide reductase MsrB [Pseudomonas sp. dw_358]
MFSRRNFLVGSLFVGGGLGVAALTTGIPTAFSATPLTDDPTQTFPVAHTEAEWHAILNPQQFKVLREQDTERPFTSPLNDEHRNGTFACAGCNQPAFASATKFDSHTGWPSFWAPMENAVGIHQDRSFGMLRQEVHCSRCGGHLGHVFDDGPKPTGLRYCMNGVAMTFTAQG